jgi:hypothetical protein
LAYLSLTKKLQAREPKKTPMIDVPAITVSTPSASIKKTIAIVNAFHPSSDAKSRNRAMTLDSFTQEVSLLFLYRLIFSN